MAVTAPLLLGITPQVAHIRYDSTANMWRVKASRQDDSSAGHYEHRDLEIFLTFAQVLVWLVQFWGSNSITGATAVEAPLGDLAAAADQIKALALDTP